MVGGQQSTRSLPHLAELFRLADAAGLLRDPELAVPAHDARCWRVHGVTADMMRDFSNGPRTGCRSTPPRCASSGRSPNIIDGCAEHGIRAISPWRDQVADMRAG